jgi:hypothetical protein
MPRWGWLRLAPFITTEDDMDMNAKKLLAVLAGIGIGAVAMAETDYMVQKGVEKVVTRKLYVQGNNASATIAGDVTVTGDITSSDDMVVGGDLAISGDMTADDITAGTINGDAVLHAQSAQNVTNGQAVSLYAGDINVLSGTGGAANTTNTITLANFGADDVGKITYVVNASGATNLVRIAKTGNFYGDTIELGAGDSMTIIPTATNVLYGK